MKSAIRKCALLSLSEIPYSWRSGANRVMLLRDDPTAQIALWCAHWTVPVQRAGSGDLGSRQQINVLRRKSPKRPALNNADRLLFVWLSRLVPTTAALAVVSPETVIRWHRAGFRAYWRSQSRPRGGRPKTSLEIRRLIRDMSIANPLWGAPRIHGELLKLGIDVGQTTVAKYMAITKNLIQV